jgi:hypothetical protein
MFSGGARLHNAGRFRPFKLAAAEWIEKSSLDRDILRQSKQGQPTVLVIYDRGPEGSLCQVHI